MTSTGTYDDRFFEKRSSTVRESARRMVPVVLELVQPKSVVDVGCARGEWLAVYREHGIEDVVGVDGAHVDPDDLLIDRTSFRARDLAEGVALDRTFDLASSLEVAEHLPARSADRFVASLAELAPIVIFSAAIPHQGGRGHVNEQWPSYWAERFLEHDYLAVDAIRPRVWNDRGIRNSYRQNTLLYVRRSVLHAREDLREQFERTELRRLDLVLPEVYLKRRDPTTRWLWRKLRRRAGQRLRSMIGLRA